ncbi:MAG: hypothetical protein AAF485_19625, partial [Chloroflexota bacterium]
GNTTIDARQGQSANALADEARVALLNSNYSLTIEKGQAALEAYQSLGYLERVEELEIYINRAEIGQQALFQLEAGEQKLDSWQFWQADQEISEATRLLQALDNLNEAQRGEQLLLSSARQQTNFAYGILGVALLLLLLNGVRRIAYRLTATPLEVEFR